jgi:hypothetical protein
MRKNSALRKLTFCSASIQGAAYRSTDILSGPNTAAMALPMSNIVCLSTATPSTNGLDVADRFTNGRDLLGIDVGDFDAKFLTQRELQLDQSNWVSTEIFCKARRHG